MNSRSKSTATLQPCNPDRANPNFTRIIAQSLWFVEQMPQGYRHPETKRNEVFMMNVTASEFVFLCSKRMRDFRRVRLGNQAFYINTETPVDSNSTKLWNACLRPMFGTLSRSQRLAKRERKNEARKDKAHVSSV